MKSMISSAARRCSSSSRRARPIQIACSTKLVRECIEQANADLAREPEIANSQIHRFLILHKVLDADDEELTRTRKVRRGFIAQKYAMLVDALYGGKQSVHVEAQVKYEDGRTGTISADLRISDAKTFRPEAAKRAA